MQSYAKVWSQPFISLYFARKMGMTMKSAVIQTYMGIKHVVVLKLFFGCWLHSV